MLLQLYSLLTYRLYLWTTSLFTPYNLCLCRSDKYIGHTQYDEPDLNKIQKAGPKTPTASKVIPLGSIITWPGFLALQE